MFLSLNLAQSYIGYIIAMHQSFYLSFKYRPLCSLNVIPPFYQSCHSLLFIDRYYNRSMITRNLIRYHRPAYGLGGQTTTDEGNINVSTAISVCARLIWRIQSLQIMLCHEVFNSLSSFICLTAASPRPNWRNGISICANEATVITNYNQGLFQLLKINFYLM